MTEERLASILNYNASKNEVARCSKESTRKEQYSFNDHQVTPDSCINSQVKKRARMVPTYVTDANGSSTVTTKTNLKAPSLTGITPPTYTSTSPNTDDFQTTVVSYLSKLAEHVDQHSVILNELVRTVRKNNEDSSIPPLGADLPNFPVDSLDEFQQFDETLNQNPSLAKYMIARLAAVGGSGIDSLTKRIMRHLMTNKLAMLYNWKGRDKLPFEKTNIITVIYDAAKRNFPVNERNDLVVANTVKDWLKNAKARENLKKKNCPNQS